MYGWVDSIDDLDGTLDGNTNFIFYFLEMIFSTSYNQILRLL